MVTVRVAIRLSVWLVSGYAHVFELLTVVIVPCRACREPGPCELTKRQRLLSVLSLRRPSSRPDASVLRPSASMSRLDSDARQHQPDPSPRRSADHLNVFSPPVRLSISNPNVRLSPPAADDQVQTMDNREAPSFHKFQLFIN